MDSFLPFFPLTRGHHGRFMEGDRTRGPLRREVERYSTVCTVIEALNYDVIQLLSAVSLALLHTTVFFSCLILYISLALSVSISLLLSQPPSLSLLPLSLFLHASSIPPLFPLLLPCWLMQNCLVRNSTSVLLSLAANRTSVTGSHPPHHHDPLIMLRSSVSFSRAQSGNTKWSFTNSVPPVGA